MSVMAQSSVSSAQQSILELLHERGALLPNDLIAAIRQLNPNMSDVDVKRIIWHMIAGHELEFSPNQEIVLPTVESV